MAEQIDGVQGTFVMADDKPDEIAPGPNPERPKRAPPTLDLDAIEISDETTQGGAADPAVKPEARSSRYAPLLSSALVAAIFGAGTAALVLWSMGWSREPARAPAPQASAAAVEALSARQDRLESRLAAPQTDKAALDALAARVASVESKAAAAAAAPPAAPSGPDPALTAQIGELEKSLATLRDQLAAITARSQQVAAAVDAVKSAPREPAQPPPDLSPINQRLDKLEAAATRLSAEVAARNAKPADDTALRRVIAASLLDVSVRAGEPYSAALAAARPFATNPDALNPLDAFAATGVPNTNALNRELLAVLPKLSPAPPTTTTGTGIVDRLQAGASRLVRIERTEPVAGNDRSAIVARVTAAALRNDVAEARRELKALAPDDRAVAQAWLDRADARDAALAASRQFAAEAMAALGKPAQ
jgi:prefoldin subunit 5